MRDTVEAGIRHVDSRSNECIKPATNLILQRTGEAEHHDKGADPEDCSECRERCSTGSSRESGPRLHQHVTHPHRGRWNTSPGTSALGRSVPGRSARAHVGTLVLVSLLPFVFFSFIIPSRILIFP